MATSSHNGLMAKEDKLKLDKISLLDTESTTTKSKTDYVVPNYEIYNGSCIWTRYMILSNGTQIDIKSWYDEYLQDVYGENYDWYYKETNYRKLTQWGIDHGYIDPSILPVVDVTVAYNLYYEGVQVGKFLVSHEVVYDTSTNTVDHHQLVVATDADEDGQSDFVFTIPGDLESRLSKLETNTTDLQSQVEVLEAKDVTTANFDKVKVSFNQLNAFMTNFATISSSNDWKTYTLADSSVTSLSSSNDSVNLDTAMNLFSKAINAKINSITPT